MNPQDLLGSRRSELGAAIRSSAGDKPHLDAFAARLLGQDKKAQFMPGFSFRCPQDLAAIPYEGFPAAAHLGFGLGTGVLDASDVGDAFLAGLARLQQRRGRLLRELQSDDVALLGLCEGVVHFRNAGFGVSDEVSDWLIRLVDGDHGQDHWLARVRSLAGDLLDGRGRLRALPAHLDTDAEALEFALRAAWPAAFREPYRSDDDARVQLLCTLLSEPVPAVGDLERAAVWLCAIDALVGYSARRLTPSVPGTVAILEDVQHSLKRWRPLDRPRRKGVRAGTWLIDDEYDVQTLLWAILYPIYGGDLVDESYLPDWGFTRPRFDLGIESLRLIIEVKIARSGSDFNKIEGEIGNDVGLYFKEPSKFDRMIVFIYDDSDKHEPEKIDGLRNALLKRDQIEGVVVVRRPSAMPPRGDRG